MSKKLTRIIRKYCGTNATCQKYVEAALKNLKPEVKVAYKCACGKKKKITFSY